MFSKTEWIYATTGKQTFLVGERSNTFPCQNGQTTGERLYKTALRDSRFSKVWIEKKFNPKALQISKRLYNMYLENKTGGKKIKTYVYCVDQKEVTKKSRVQNSDRKTKRPLPCGRKKTKR